MEKENDTPAWQVGNARFQFGNSLLPNWKERQIRFLKGKPRRRQRGLIRGPTLPRNGDKLVGDELCPVLLHPDRRCNHRRKDSGPTMIGNAGQLVAGKLWSGHQVFLGFHRPNRGP
jgi:hypothetical protein